MKSIEQLTEEVLALPDESRVLLLEQLMNSLEYEPEPSIQANWLSVVDRRREEVRNGSIKMISSGDVFAEARRLLNT